MSLPWLRFGGGGVNSGERANKKRRLEDVIGLNAVGLLPPLATALGGLNGKQNGNELMILQRRLVRSKEETNIAIQLRETVESAATLRREIREEKDRRATLWKEFVQNVGDESLATTRVKAFRVAMDNGEHVSSGSEVKGSYGTLIENVIEQDDLVRQMTMQHAALNRAVDQLITKEKNGASDVASVYLWNGRTNIHGTIYLLCQALDNFCLLFLRVYLVAVGIMTKCYHVSHRMYLLYSY